MKSSCSNVILHRHGGIVQELCEGRPGRSISLELTDFTTRYSCERQKENHY